jgi:hypothetical protein
MNDLSSRERYQIIANHLEAPPKVEREVERVSSLA